MGFDKVQPVAIQVAVKELIGRAPQIKPELTELEIAEGALDVILVRVEIDRPLLEGEDSSSSDRCAISISSNSVLNILLSKSSSTRKEWLPG